MSLKRWNLDLLLGESLSKVAHHTGKLLPIDKTVSILVREILTFYQLLNWWILPRQTLGKPRGFHPRHSPTLAETFVAIYLRTILYFLQGVTYFWLDENYLQGHHAEEFREVNHSSAILIHLQHEQILSYIFWIMLMFVKVKNQQYEINRLDKIWSLFTNDTPFSCILKPTC